MITAILLTAGESRRMTRDNNLLLEYKGHPMVRHVASQLIKSDVDEIIVLTGYQHRQIEEALSGLELKFVYNPDYYSGMASSVTRGTEEISEKSQGIMVCLSDMPKLEAMHYNALVKKYAKEKEAGNTPIIRPVHRDSFGYPVVFDKAFFTDIKNCRAQDGCNPVITENQEHYIPYTLANEAYYLDIDTPTDYYKLRE